MKKIVTLCFIGCLLCFLSCKNEDGGNGNQDGLLSLALKAGTTTYRAVIDQEERTATVGGIEYASRISGAVYEVAEGATVQPDPATVKEWKKEQQFQITLANGTQQIYTVRLKDLREETETGRAVVIGYLPGSDWEYNAEFKNIRWEYLTHINVSFLYVTATGELLDSSVSEHLDEIRAEAQKHSVKVLISLQSDGQRGFAEAIKTERVRKKLAADAIRYVRDHQLDGVDVDFEVYDAVGPDLLAFVKELHAQKDPEMLQTCAVATWNAGQGYSTEWHNYFDYINLMAYDFTGGWGQEGQHASYEQAVDLINLWLTTLQAPASKLVLGLPFYGYSWDEIPGVDDVKAIRYHQILANYPGQDVAGRDQLGRTYYNGKPTLLKKCRYVKENGLAGVMIWQLFQDAKTEEESLLKAVGEEMLNEEGKK